MILQERGRRWGSAFCWRPVASLLARSEDRATALPKPLADVVPGASGKLPTAVVCGAVASGRAGGVPARQRRSVGDLRCTNGGTKRSFVRGSEFRVYGPCRIGGSEIQSGPGLVRNSR